MARLGASLDDEISVGIVDNVKDEFEKIIFTVNSTTINANSTGAYIFIAPGACTVLSASEVHTAVSTGDGLVMLEKCTSTGDAEIGSTGSTDLLSTGFDLTAVAGVVQEATLSTASGALSLTAGQRLALDISGDLTSVTGGIVTVSLRQDA